MMEKRTSKRTKNNRNDKEKKGIDKKTQGLGNRQKKKMMKQRIFAISTMSCKNPWNEKP